MGLMKPSIPHGANMKVCVDDYADAPNGIPVWCVEQQWGVNTVVQLMIEIAAFIVLFIIAQQFFRYLRRRKQRRLQREEQLNKSESYPDIWHR